MPTTKIQEDNVRQVRSHSLPGESPDPQGLTMKMPRSGISLVLTSTIFFFFWVAPLTGLNPAFYGATAVLSCISLLGLLLFILTVQRRDGSRYPALLLLITVSALGIVSYVLYPESKPFLSDPVSDREGIWISILSLLAPASMVFFHTFPKRLKAKALVPFQAIAGIAIFAVILFACAFKSVALSPTPTLHPWSGLLILYWTVGLPLIGFNFLSIAVRCRGDN